MHFVPRAFVLRDLSLSSRLALSMFLVTVGIGYFGALVQLHFHHASPGKLLPDASDAAHAYHGRTGVSQLERLIAFGEGKPFNGNGTMSEAFTTRSAGWKGAVRRRSKEKNVSLAQAEIEVRREREGERLALLAWIRGGAEQQAFEANDFALPTHLQGHPITSEFVEADSEGVVRAKIANLFEARCTRCHNQDAGGQAGQIHLETWEQIHDYCEVETNGGGGMSLKRLAQSTHVHLLGFAVLYGCTGLIVTFTSYPGWLRGLLGSFPLLAQVLEIGCWWLARLDPVFAKGIIALGGAVAVGVFLQITLSLFNMYGKTGKTVLVLTLLGAALGAGVVKETIIDPYLVQEASNLTE